MSDDRQESLPIEGEISKRYRVVYGGQIVGSSDSAKEVLEQYRKYEEVVRPVIDRSKKWRYSFIDGRKEITITELRQAVRRKGIRA